MDNDIMMLLPLLMMGQKGDNAQLMQTMMSLMSGGQAKNENNSIAEMMSKVVNKGDGNKDTQANLQMMNMLAGMMKSKDKGEEKGEEKGSDFTKGDNSKLISMLMAMMANGEKKAEERQVLAKDISAIEAIAGGEVMEKIAEVINHRNKNKS